MEISPEIMKSTEPSLDECDSFTKHLVRVNDDEIMKAF